MSILSYKALPVFMQSIISAVSTNLNHLIDPNSEYHGISDYVSLIEDISRLTYETAKTIFESSVEELDFVFCNRPNRVQQFYVKHKSTRIQITPFGRANINRTI